MIFTQYIPDTKKDGLTPSFYYAFPTGKLRTVRRERIYPFLAGKWRAVREGQPCTFGSRAKRVIIPASSRIPTPKITQRIRLVGLGGTVGFFCLLGALGGFAGAILAF